MSHDDGDIMEENYHSAEEHLQPKVVKIYKKAKDKKTEI